MASLTQANSLQRNVLVDMLSTAEKALSSFTDTLCPIHRSIQGLIMKLQDPDPRLMMMIVGNGRCGKSEFVNALLGKDLLPSASGIDISENDDPTSTFDIVVRPSVSDTPTLRGSDGKILAVEDESVKNRIKSENEILKSSTESHYTPRNEQLLPYLECTPHFIKNYNMEAEVSIIDSFRKSPIVTSSGGYESFCADVFVYLLNYEMLKTPEEDDMLSGIPLSLFDSPERVQFVVTNTGAFFNKILQITSDHDLEDFHNKFDSVQEIISYIVNVVIPKKLSSMKSSLNSPTSTQSKRIKERQVSVVYTKLGLYSRYINTQKENVSLTTLYDYCDIAYSSSFMQEIDSIPVEYLQRMAFNRSEEQLVGSGLLPMERSLRITAFNSGLYLLLSCAMETISLFNYFIESLRQVVPQLKCQQMETSGEMDELITSLNCVKESQQCVQRIILIMRTELDDLALSMMTDFWNKRLVELREILNGAQPTKYKTRQHTAVYAITKAVSSLKEFVLNTYVKDKLYIEKQSSEDQTHWDFVSQNKEAIISVISNNLKEKLLDVGQAFAHHLKDELNLILPSLLIVCKSRKNELLDMLKGKSIDLIFAAERHSGGRESQLSLENTCGKWRDINVAAPDDRCLNNCTRQLPYETSESCTKAMQTDTSHLTTTETDISVISENCYDVIVDKYLKSWDDALSCSSSAHNELVFYDKNAVSSCLDYLSETFSTYVKSYVDQLESGIAIQRDELNEMESNTSDIQRQLDVFLPTLEELHSVTRLLRESVVWDYDNAHSIAQEKSLSKPDDVLEEAA